jgi:hypothetical protein
MHHHCEIIMPPTDDIEAAVTAILKPFDEDPDANEEDVRLGTPFWDWWVIGGRFAGMKFQSTLNAEKLKAFHAELAKRKVTVSGLTCGKQELNPSTQIPLVDGLWRDYFPDTKGPCPLFSHSNDQYNSKDLLPDDVMRFWAVPNDLKVARVIFAADPYEKGETSPTFMLADSIWNGCNFEETAWDGTFADAVERFKTKHKHYAADYVERITPKDDWLVVTVDYHS